MMMIQCVALIGLFNSTVLHLAARQRLKRRACSGSKKRPSTGPVAPKVPFNHKCAPQTTPQQGALIGRHQSAGQSAPTMFSMCVSADHKRHNRRQSIRLGKEIPNRIQPDCKKYKENN